MVMVGSGVSDTDDHHWCAYGEGEDYHDSQQGEHITEPRLITMAVYYK
jgi:hypothetical protein